MIADIEKMKVKIRITKILANKVTTPREKVKIIKEYSGLSYRAMANTGASNTAIAKIIKGGIELSYKIARVIATNVNEKLALDITPEYLIEPVEKQAKRIIDNTINKLDEKLIDIEELEVLFNDNKQYLESNVEYLLKCYEVLAKGYRLIDLEKSLKYINQGEYLALININIQKDANKIDVMIKYEVVFKSLMAICEYSQGENEKALKIYKGIANKTRDIELNYKIDYNTTLCLIDLNEYQKVEKQIVYIINNYTLPSSDLWELELMKANNATRAGKHIEALEIYEKLLFISLNEGNVKNTCIIYYNISTVYVKLKDWQTAQKYMELRFKINNNINIINHLLFAGTIFNSKNYFKQARESLKANDAYNKSLVCKEEIKFAIKNNDVSFFRESINYAIKTNVKLKYIERANSFIADNFEKIERDKYFEVFEK